MSWALCIVCDLLNGGTYKLTLHRVTNERSIGLCICVVSMNVCVYVCACMCVYMCACVCVCVHGVYVSCRYYV